MPDYPNAAPKCMRSLPPPPCPAVQAMAKYAEAGRVFEAAGLADPFPNLAAAVLKKTLPVPSLEANHLSSMARNLNMTSTNNWRWSELEHKWCWAVLLSINAPKYMLLRGTMGQGASGSKQDKMLVANVQMNFCLPSPQALNEWAKKTRPQAMISTGINVGAIQRFLVMATKESQGHSGTATRAHHSLLHSVGGEDHQARTVLPEGRRSWLSIKEERQGYGDGHGAPPSKWDRVRPDDHQEVHGAGDGARDPEEGATAAEAAAAATAAARRIVCQSVACDMGQKPACVCS
jgi:hypothetical protein